MDATRADVEFTAEVVQIAIDEGATTINIPDTVGYTMPHEFTAYLERLYELAPGLQDVVLSVHCHDDLGLAVANSFAGVQAGARQVECAINGIGERAGNASLEEIVMLLHTRQADVGLHTGVVTQEIARTSRLVSRLTGYVGAAEQGDRRPQRVRARVRHPPGRRAQGAHDATRSWTRRRSAWTRTRSCSASTPAATRCRQALAELGYRGRRPGAEHRVQALQGDRGQEEAGHRDGPRGARHRRAARGDAGLHARVVRGRGLLAARRRTRPSASRCPTASEATGSFTGDGPVDAIFRAINAATGQRGEAARVPRRRGHRRPGRARRDVASCSSSTASTGAGQGVSTDIIEAAGRAYVRALSNAVRRRSVADQAADLTAEAASKSRISTP